MKKIIFPLLITISALLMFFFARGTLVIKPSETPATISVDKKSYQNRESLSVRLFPGNHKIKIEKDSYKLYEETISVSIFQKKELSPRLELTEEIKDRKEIEKISKEFIEAWYTYETQTSLGYLEKIKPYMTNDFYESIYYVNTKRPQDFKGQVPLKTTALSVETTAYSGTEASSVVVRNSTEPASGKSYKKKTRIDLAKEGDKWLVSYLMSIL